MDPLQFLVPLDWLEVVGPILPLAILVLAIANMATRLFAHKAHVRQAEDADEVERYAPHTVTTVGLLLVTLLYIPFAIVGGTILALLAVTLLLADFFEFEARNVEARNDMEIDRPNSALLTSLLLFGYAAYYSLFFLVQPFWDLVVA